MPQNMVSDTIMHVTQNTINGVDQFEISIVFLMSKLYLKMIYNI